MAMLSMFILMFLLVPYVQDVANWVTDSNFLLDSKHHTSKHLPWPQGGRMYFLLTLSLTIFLVWVNLMFMDVKQAKASKTLMCLDCFLDLWEDLSYLSEIWTQPTAWSQVPLCLGQTKQTSCKARWEINSL